MPECMVNSLRLHYEDRGNPDAPPLLLIPGLGGNHLTWSPVARYLTNDLRLLLVDPRDAGKSDKARTPYAIADVAEDMAAVIRAAGVKRTAVAGISMGGAIAQELAIRHPDLVERLVLVATYDADDRRGSFMFEHLAHLRRTLCREDYIRTLLPWIYTWQEMQTSVDPEAAVQRLAEDPYFQTPEAYERQMRATVSFHSRDRLHRIQCPTSLIFGDEDLFTPMRFARSLQQGIK
ncbi:MAG: alpha/beta fold hydrolase, partial [Chloroflexi bacterium]|nr:alpha/beta fold hydrolase [Chloroflexota bacterium]